MWASERGHLDTVRVLVELGASLEAVNKVNIHAHAFAYTCCVKHVSGIRRMTIIIMIHACAYGYIPIYNHMQIFVFICMDVCMYTNIQVYICVTNSQYLYIYICMYIYAYIYIYTHTRTHTQLYRRVTLSCRQIKHAMISKTKKLNPKPKP
jgi:hypothetical protein